ncbi:MAG: hypothetical protein DMG05_24495 [Acidobacteria bacterium]|nr:MAG: hypothetical protein DMG05_24495 [Acidobacteriota bacterium]
MAKPPRGVAVLADWTSPSRFLRDRSGVWTSECGSRPPDGDRDCRRVAIAAQRSAPTLETHASFVDGKLFYKQNQTGLKQG